MSSYLIWQKRAFETPNRQTIDEAYNQGFLFARTGKGEMYKTRSLRIDLTRLKLSSENRRILRKVEDLRLTAYDLPLTHYHWSIAKLAKDFYDDKFGPGVFSANKIKELLTAQKNNFNVVLKYTIENEVVGYAICVETDTMLHYSYPFYVLQPEIANLGLGMMLKAIVRAQEQGKKYVYLGSASRPTDIYKLQFEGLEWFDGEKWKVDLEELKQVLIKK